MDTRLVVRTGRLSTGEALLEIHGVLDTKSAPVLEKRLRSAIDECGVQPPHVQLDLSDVSYLDRDALDVVLRVSQDLTAVRGRLELHHPSPAVVRLLHEAYLDGASWSSLPD